MLIYTILKVWKISHTNLFIGYERSGLIRLLTFFNMMLLLIRYCWWRTASLFEIKFLNLAKIREHTSSTNTSHKINERAMPLQQHRQAKRKGWPARQQFQRIHIIIFTISSSPYGSAVQLAYICFAYVLWVVVSLNILERLL